MNGLKKKEWTVVINQLSSFHKPRNSISFFFPFLTEHCLTMEKNLQEIADSHRISATKRKGGGNLFMHYKHLTYLGTEIK